MLGPAGKQKAIGTGQFSEIACDVAFRSIGYMSEPIPGYTLLSMQFNLFLDVPFDKSTGVIPNNKGRVIDLQNPAAAHGIK